MKKILLWFSCLIIIVGLSLPAWAVESNTSAPEDTPPKPGGVKSNEERVEQLEEAFARMPESEKWYDRIQVSGRVEVEAVYEKTDFGVIGRDQ